MAVQFTLSRMFQLVVVVAVLCSLFASLRWYTALFALIIVNALACIAFAAVKRPITAGFAALTSFLIAATLSFTWFPQDYGDVVVPWAILIGARVSQLATVLSWFLSDSPPRRRRSED
jgi:hypothetical protein